MEKPGNWVLCQNVLAELKKAGWNVTFYSDTTLDSLDQGDLSVKISLAKLNQVTSTENISKELGKVSFASAGFLSFAKKLLEDPGVIDNNSLCIQNSKPEPDATFVCALAYGWSGERGLYVYRGSDVWDEGSVFLGRPQV